MPDARSPCSRRGWAVRAGSGNTLDRSKGCLPLLTVGAAFPCAHAEPAGVADERWARIRGLSWLVDDTLSREEEPLRVEHWSDTRGWSLLFFSKASAVSMG
mmetsp:Transcript_77764/g.219902  ORF Transcript_77764/g.219902 Transcript_77764/m.219902 type:complete len:101 (+) Transcript_77764:449-751(+)